MTDKTPPGTPNTEVIFHYSCLNNVSITGPGLSVFIHNASDPRDVMDDLMLISSQPVLRKNYSPANAA